MRDIFIISAKVTRLSTSKTEFFPVYLNMNDVSRRYHWSVNLDSALKFESSTEAKEWWQKNKGNVIMIDDISVDTKSITIDKLIPYNVERLEV